MSAADVKTVIVAGGAGDVGEGIVRAFCAAGWSVIVPSRSRARLDALATAVEEDLELVETDLSDPDAARRFATRIGGREDGVGAIVAALGGWAQHGRLLDIGPEDWARVLRDNLTSHLIAAQALTPLLARQRSAYLMINGGAADAPVPGAGAVSIAAAAQLMLMRVLDGELAAFGARALTLELDSVINTRARPRPKPEWITADEVGRLALLLVAPEAAALHGHIVKAGELRRAPG
jgi:3-oxoacyl-[acyl-carrier protein] reductase